MKIKKLMTALMINLTLILNPINIFAWGVPFRYNVVNVRIANLLRFMEVMVAIAYAIVGTLYAINSKQENKIKVRKILIWLVITIIAIFILSRAAAAVYAAGLTPKY